MPFHPSPNGKRQTIVRVDDSSDSDTLTMEKPICSSRTQESRNQRSSSPEAELPQKLPDKNEASFLADITDEKKRAKVQMILKFDTSIEDRMDRIKKVDVMYSIVTKCEAWLNEKENSTDFISQLPESCQEFAIEYVEQKDIEGLEQLVTLYGNKKAKEAFGRWKLKNGIVDEKNVDDEKPVKIEPINETKRSSKPSKKYLPAEEETPPRVKRSGKSKTHKKKEKEDDDHRSQLGKQGKREDRSSTNEEHESKGKKLYPTMSDKDEDDDASFDDAGEDIPPQFPFIADMPEEMNVVILGGTGKGKSTYINAVANLLTRQTLDAACESPNVLIRASFHHYEADGSEMLIEHEPTIPIERQGDGEDEDNRAGQSATQSPKSYIFEFGSAGNKKILRLIDTPGVGDVRGIEQDQMNFTKIINFISSFKVIHAFLFLLKPNEARLDLGFKYGMNELLRHLHASAANNIVFCMSNGKGVSYRPGDTYPTLKKYLDDIYEEKKIRIKLDGRYFVFDSIHFRYAAAYCHKIQYPQNEIKGFQESWNFGREKLSSMISLISGFDPHDVKNTLSVNKVRKAIEFMARPLAEIAKNQLENMNIIEKKQQEIEKCLANGDDLRGSLYIERIHMDTEDLDQPVTVCTHGECVDRIPLHHNGAEEIVYSQECHKACYLLNLLPEQMPNENIKECEIFSDRLDENKCTQCGHGYEVHMHMKYRLVRRVERSIDREIEESLEMNANQVEVARQFIADREEQRLAYQRDLEKKQEYCAHFAIFLRENSVLHYNDQYLAYLTNMIREEEQSNRRGGSDETLEKLKNARAQYQEIVKVFEQTAKQGGKAKSIHEIEAMIEEIKNMDNGEIVRGVEKLEWFETNPYVHMDPVIEVPSQSLFEKIWNNPLMSKIRGGKDKKREGTSHREDKTRRHAVYERPSYYQ